LNDANGQVKTRSEAKFSVKGSKTSQLYSSRLGVEVLVWSKKCEVKFLLIVKQIKADTIQLQKREGYLNLPFI